MQKNQQVKVHQVAMELLKRKHGSPFVAILMLASELENKGHSITAASLRKYLFPLLPERACYNLLKKLAAQGYLEGYEHSFGLTERGYESAEDRSIWEGEKGIYNVYTTKSSFTDREIIFIEPIERNAEDNRDGGTVRVPYDVSKYEGETIIINGQEYLIERIDNKCFRLKDETWTLKISVEKGNAILSARNGQREFLQELSIPGSDIVSEVLGNHFGSRYNEGYVFVSFDPADTSFIRSVKVKEPFFNEETFDPCTFDNIKHRPATLPDAERWYRYLLINNIDNYFLSDEAFEDYSKEYSKNFDQLFPLQTLTRKDLVKELSCNKEQFYNRAKLETIDYLSY